MPNTNQKVYVETSIVSYLTARPSRDIIVAGHQQLTHEWWDRRRETFDVFVSTLVIQECSAGDPKASEDRLRIIAPMPVLDVDQKAVSLSKELIRSGALPIKPARDALPTLGKRHAATAN